jgi:Arc/MetJ family transcription regulator
MMIVPASGLPALLTAGQAQRKRCHEWLERKAGNVYIWRYLYTSESGVRTNIDIDDELMAQAMRATGQTTKKATVEAALKKAVLLSIQKDTLEELWGMGWEGDFEEMRKDWSPDVDWAFKDDVK